MHLRSPEKREGFCYFRTDSLAPLCTRQIHQTEMDENSLVIMVAPQPEWIKQADCIDM